MWLLFFKRTPLQWVTTPVGSPAARRMMMLGRGILLLRIAVPFLAVAGTGAGESPPVLGNAPPPLGGDVPHDKDSLTTSGRRSAGGVISGKGAAGVSKSFLVRL